jgi:hypothetical protein
MSRLLYCDLQIGDLVGEVGGNGKLSRRLGLRPGRKRSPISGGRAAVETIKKKPELAAMSGRESLQHGVIEKGKKEVVDGTRWR